MPGGLLHWHGASSPEMGISRQKAIIMTDPVARLYDLILFFSSSTAQVWAAFLIFYVLLLRDVEQERRSKIKELWSSGRELWQGLLDDLQDPKEDLFRKHPEWGLDPETVSKADSDINAFRKVVKAIEDHGVIMILENEQRGPLLEHLHLRKNLTPTEWKQAVSPISSRLQRIEHVITSPLVGLKVGLIATGANLGLMLIPTYLPKTTAAGHCIIGILVVSNLLFGWIFYRQVKYALEFVTEPASYLFSDHGYNHPPNSGEKISEAGSKPAAPSKG